MSQEFTVDCYWDLETGALCERCISFSSELRLFSNVSHMEIYRDPLSDVRTCTDHVVASSGGLGSVLIGPLHYHTDRMVDEGPS